MKAESMPMERKKRVGKRGHKLGSDGHVVSKLVWECRQVGSW
jgi:hypothetical protein